MFVRTAPGSRQPVLDPTSRIGGFRLSHEIEYRYPDRALFTPLDRQTRSISDLPIDNVGQRYCPMPLAPVGSYIYEFQLDILEAPYKTFSRARAGRADEWDPEPGTDLHRLEVDMAGILDCAGKTVLSALVTYRTGAAPLQRDVRITIGRSSEFYEERDRKRADNAIYNIPFRDFQSLRWTVGRQSWYTTLDELIYRKTDRAVVQVDKRFGINNPADGRGWLPHRDMRLSPHIVRELSRHEFDQKTAPDDTDMDTNMAGEDRYICPISFCRYDWQNHVPVELLSCKHIMCHTCISRWCGAKDLVEVKCPFCRTFLSGSDTGNTIIGANGLRTPIGDFDPAYQQSQRLDVHSNYTADPRFNAWENFELSCADLDFAHWERWDIEFQFSEARIAAFWNHFCHHARAEPATSTPAHLNAMNWPLFDFVENCIVKPLFRELDGTRMTYKLFRRLWDQEIEQALTKALLQSRELMQVRNMPEDFEGVQRLIVQEEVLDRVHVLLYRTILADLRDGRRCGHRNIKGLHLHGTDRMYLCTL